MRNNIASFEKSISDGVTICKNIDVEFIFALDFAQILTSLLLDSSKVAILFLIYLLADKGKCQKFLFPYLLCEIVSHGQENKRLKENEIIKGFMHK